MSNYAYTYSYVPMYMGAGGDTLSQSQVPHMPHMSRMPYAPYRDLNDLDSFESVSTDSFDDIMTDPSGADDASSVSGWTRATAMPQTETETELPNNAYEVSTLWMFDDDMVSLHDETVSASATNPRSRTLERFDFDRYPHADTPTKTKTK